jgi:hypothetical protein
MNWVFISQKTSRFIVIAVKTSNLTEYSGFKTHLPRKKFKAHGDYSLKSISLEYKRQREEQNKRVFEEWCLLGCYAVWLL